jgi:hypothetical protein
MSPRSLSSNFEKVSDKPSPVSKHGVNRGPITPVLEDMGSKPENIDKKSAVKVDNSKIDNRKDGNTSIFLLADLDSDEEDGWS